MKTDIHIHLVGGPEDGCYVSPQMLRRPWLKLVSFWSGLGVRHGGEYVSRLVNYIRESPIDVAVVLACDAIYDERGDIDSKTPLYVPNDYVLRVCHQHEELLPGVSIHPNRKDAMPEIDRCVEAGAVLVKWIPNAQGIDPADQRYRAYYRRLRGHGLPLLSHAGSEFTLPARIPTLGDPARLRLALEEGVTVIAAHCGVSYGGLSNRHLKTWLRLIPEYPNLYGDLAALSFGLGGRQIKRLLKSGLAETRLVNGSDFPVPPVRAITDLIRHSNPLTRDHEIKKKLGVPDSVFCRGYRLVRRH